MLNRPVGKTSFALIGGSGNIRFLPRITEEQPIIGKFTHYTRSTGETIHPMLEWDVVKLAQRAR